MSLNESDTKVKEEGMEFVNFVDVGTDVVTPVHIKSEVDVGDCFVEEYQGENGNSSDSSADIAEVTNTDEGGGYPLMEETQASKSSAFAPGKNRGNRKKLLLTCTYCNYTCVDFDTMADHENTHKVPLRDRGMYVTERTEDGAKLYKCAFCSYSSVHDQCMVRHVRTHTGEKPYKCKYCSYRTANNTHITRHERTHTGEKPYKCSHCELRFIQKNDMVRHMRNHIGERAYKCSLCSFSADGRKSLSTHERMHELHRIAETGTQTFKPKVKPRSRRKTKPQTRPQMQVQNEASLPLQDQSETLPPIQVQNEASPQIQVQNETSSQIQVQNETNKTPSLQLPDITWNLCNLVYDLIQANKVEKEIEENRERNQNKEIDETEVNTDEDC